MSESSRSSQEELPQAQFKSRLQSILYTTVSVDNISRFADDALEELVNLNESVVARYQRDFEESALYIGTELEDKAYEAYGLEDLNTVLSRIIEVRDKIASLSI